MTSSTASKQPKARRAHRQESVASATSSTKRPRRIAQANGTYKQYLNGDDLEEEYDDDNFDVNTPTDERHLTNQTCLSCGKVGTHAALPQYCNKASRAAVFPSIESIFSRFFYFRSARGI